ncbi:MAG: hypothetical protein NTZ68_00470 [Candidatus Dependentiae bacterium]|nr:hypothetical protein [Candidatus Dependentiae bacterium]
MFEKLTGFKKFTDFTDHHSKQFDKFVNDSSSRFTKSVSDAKEGISSWWTGIKDSFNNRNLKSLLSNHAEGVRNESQDKILADKMKDLSTPERQKALNDLWMKVRVDKFQAEARAIKKDKSLTSDQITKKIEVAQDRFQAEKSEIENVMKLSLKPDEGLVTAYNKTSTTAQFIIFDMSKIIPTDSIAAQYNSLINEGAIPTRTAQDGSQEGSVAIDMLTNKYSSWVSDRLTKALTDDSSTPIADQIKSITGNKWEEINPSLQKEIELEVARNAEKTGNQDTVNAFKAMLSDAYNEAQEAIKEASAVNLTPERMAKLEKKAAEDKAAMDQLTETEDRAKKDVQSARLEKAAKEKQERDEADRATSETNDKADDDAKTAKEKQATAEAIAREKEVVQQAEAKAAVIKAREDADRATAEARAKADAKAKDVADAKSKTDAEAAFKESVRKATADAKLKSARDKADQATAEVKDKADADAKAKVDAKSKADLEKGEKLEEIKREITTLTAKKNQAQIRSESFSEEDTQKLQELIKSRNELSPPKLAKAKTVQPIAPAAKATENASSASALTSRTAARERLKRNTTIEENSIATEEQRMLDIEERPAPEGKTEKMKQETDKQRSAKLLVDFQVKAEDVKKNILEKGLDEHISDIIDPYLSSKKAYWFGNRPVDVMVEDIQNEIINPYIKAIDDLYNPANLKEMLPEDQKALQESYANAKNAYKEILLKSLKTFAESDGRTSSELSDINIKVAQILKTLNLIENPEVKK